MSQAIYISPKAGNVPALIFIKTHCHNPNGWIEKPNGEAIKLYQPHITEVKHGPTQTNN